MKVKLALAAVVVVAALWAARPGVLATPNANVVANAATTAPETKNMPANSAGMAPSPATAPEATTATNANVVANSATTAPSSEPTSAAAEQLPWLRQDQNQPLPTIKSDPGETLWRMLGTVAIILVLGGGALLITKKLRPKIASLAGQKVQVVSVTHLGTKKAVYLLQAGNRQILVGSTPTQISMLADVTGAFTPAQTAPKLPAVTMQEAIEKAKEAQEA